MFIARNKLQKHGVVRDDYASEMFYFITIRHPYDLYSSLYRYGLDGRGGVYKGLKELGKSTVYASFDSFIEFVADPKCDAFRCKIQRGNSQTSRIYVFQVYEAFTSISGKTDYGKVI